MASTTLSVPNGTNSVTSINSHSESVKSDEIDGSESYGEKSTSFGSRNQVDSLEEMNYSNDNASDADHCGICCKKLSSPRVLSCLHVFCETCLDDHCNNTKDKELVTNSIIIACPMCQQETQLTAKGAASLPCDYVLTNILDMFAIKNTSVLCTSCKALENAVARCSDCANFLCPNCNTAHQFMRCFENHKVIAFDELRKSEDATPIHKPIFCESHPTESMKFYCYTCKVRIVVFFFCQFYNYETFKNFLIMMNGLLRGKKKKIRYQFATSACLSITKHQNIYTSASMMQNHDKRKS